MSEFKGTQGDWVILHEAHRLESTIYSNQKRICEVKSFGIDFETILNNEVCTDPSYEERIFNAQLISCTLEMLEMLEIAKRTILMLKNSMQAHPDCSEFSEFEHYVNSGSDVANEIESLIKKATEL